MSYEPKHSLSECLKRRHRSLTKRMAALQNQMDQQSRDELVACTEEVYSIEYWLRVTEESERATRMDSLFETITSTIQGYDEAMGYRK